MIRAPNHVNYELIWNGEGGRLTSDATFDTGITGYHVQFNRHVVVDGRVARAICELFEDGVLIVRTGTEYDFGSGPAIDTPSVVIASLAHDMICHLTNARLLPWSCRSLGDTMYRVMLGQNGTGFARRCRHFIGVRLYSELIARWRDRHEG